MTRNERALLAGQAGLLLAAVAAAILTSRTKDWEPAGLVVILTAGTVVSGLFPISVRSMKVDGSSIGLILSAGLLGPAPAVAAGIVSTLSTAIRTRPSARILLCNLAIFGCFPLVAGLLLRIASEQGWTDDEAAFAVIVAVVFLVANLLNFVVVASDLAVTLGNSFSRDFKTVYLPMLPVELAAAALTGSLAGVYQTVGIAVAALVVIVGLVFQYQFHTNYLAQQRGEQLAKRTKELASLQVGLLSTVMKTLSLRDKVTARHSAAVARYAREIARAVGMSEDRQEFVHTSALLHDIGKFIFPDSILFADTSLTDEQYKLVRSHPQRGAELVASIEGYGPVADVILAHHERIDGRGYPFGTAGETIPIEARMIAIADTYDVMTARDSYRKPVTPEVAIAELRRVSGTQLDAKLVGVFADLVESGRLMFRHSDDHDFECELQLDKRAAEYAEPRVAA